MPGGAKIKYGAQERQTLACMHNLGELHHLRWLCKDGDGLQELQNALPLLTEALAGRRKLLGQHDLDTLQTLDMLALVYQDSNNLVLAEQHATEAVAGFRFLLAVFFAGMFIAPAGPRKTRNYTLLGTTWKG